MHCDAAWWVLRGSLSLDCQPDDCHGHAAHSMHWPRRRQKCFQRNCQTAHGREVWNEGPHSAVCSARRVSHRSCSLDCRPQRSWVGGLLGVLCPLNRSLSCISRSSRAIVRIRWNADRSEESEEEVCRQEQLRVLLSCCPSRATPCGLVARGFPRPATAYNLGSRPLVMLLVNARTNNRSRRPLVVLSVNALTMASAEFKTKDNAAFVAKNYEEAIDFFTEGIAVDASNHVLYVLKPF